MLRYLLIAQAAVLLAQSPQGESVVARSHAGVAALADSAYANRRRHLIVGAAAGAAIGILTGLVATRDFTVGCKAVYPSHCNAQRTEWEVRLTTAAFVGAVGAAVGALIGALWR
jgi:ElaB/YqjD/DUF883 family membrane-anchored ribosome-binding protein